MNLQLKKIRPVKYCTAIFFLLSGFLFPASSMAQVLYANEDNTVTINVPGVDPSKLIITAENGTIIRKKADKWVARPTGEKDENEDRKDFVITISTNENGKNQLLASKTYEVKTAYIIDYYDEKTHRLPRLLWEYNDVLLKAEGIEKMCFYINNPNFIDEVLELFLVNCDFRFDDYSKGWLGGQIPFYLIITEAWDTSGKKVELPPIVLRR